MLVPVTVSDATLIPSFDTAEVLLGNVMAKESESFSCVMSISCGTTIASLLVSWDAALTMSNDSLFSELLRLSDELVLGAELMFANGMVELLLLEQLSEMLLESSQGEANRSFNCRSVTLSPLHFSAPLCTAACIRSSTVPRMRNL
jgi:hypothetical protein